MAFLFGKHVLFYFDSIEMFYLFLIDNLVIYRENDLMV